MADSPVDPIRRLSRAGRKAGIPNRLSGTVKDAFLQAFEMLGGAEGLARWARTKRKVKIGNKIVELEPNLETFYVLAAKLIPSETKTSVSGNIGHGHYVAREIAVEQRDKLPGPRAPQYDIIEGELVPEPDGLGLSLDSDHGITLQRNTT